jgi:predicted phosphodiesterase
VNPSPHFAAKALPRSSPAFPSLVPVAAEITRIFSDIHYGDLSSQVRTLTQLRPLLEGVGSLVLNGDTLETRVGPNPELTAAQRAEVTDFFPRHAPRITFLTGNHDADFSPHHALEFAAGTVFVTHGDVLYEDIVPWSQDAAFIRRRLAEEFSALPEANRQILETQLEVFRRVAISIPQRHQSERNPLKHAVRLATDSVWPPSRLMRILRAWREMPERAASLLHRHRPQAKFILIGHTHHPGVWRRPNGVVVINTGSFTRPFGGCVVDLSGDRLVVRKIVARRREYNAGPVIAEFALAAG